jgi:hypothetical protein
MVAVTLLAIFAPNNAFLLLYRTAVAGMFFVWMVILLTPIPANRGSWHRPAAAPCAGSSSAHGRRNRDSDGNGRHRHHFLGSWLALFDSSVRRIIADNVGFLCATPGRS